MKNWVVTMYCKLSVWNRLLFETILLILLHTPPLFTTTITSRVQLLDSLLNMYVQIVNTATRRGSVGQNMPTVHVM